MKKLTKTVPSSTIGECLTKADKEAVKSVPVKVYNRWGKAFLIKHIHGDIYSMLDKFGRPTGTTINLATALDCRSYFSGPLSRKRKHHKNKSSKKSKATCCA